MDQQDRPDPRRRVAVVGAAVLASLAIAVPAAFAASGGGDNGSGSTQTQTQPAPQHKQDAPPRDGERGSWGDHRGPCPRDKGEQQGSDSSGSSSYAPSPSSDVVQQF